MVRVVLILALLLMLPGEVMAKDGAAWHKKRVVVHDYTSAAYKPYVAEMVAAFNAMLPKRAPKLVYREQPERACNTLDKKRPKVITICLSGGEWDMTATDAKHGEITRATVILIGNDTPDQIHNTICHELMHAVTDAPDDYRDPHLTESCVQGMTPYPGAWDKAYARKVYRKHGR